jgi:muramidase (phage lysozyme)
MQAMRDAIALVGLLDDANVKAFLAVIRKGEGTADPDGYRRHFGGTHFDSYADHPREIITAGLGKNQYTSSAAGAYQFLTRTWDGLVRKYGFANFEPKTQDIAAVALIDGRKALDDVISGRFEQAVHKCNREWASLPESPYGQPVKTMAQARATYIENGGAFEIQARAITPQTLTSVVTTEAPMPLPAIIGALLPSIIESIPKLGKLFGSGSAVAERNVKAAELAVQIVQEATGARNAQEAAEMVKADPAAAQAAVAAVEERWYELTESGGGGIDGARKFVERISDGPGGAMTLGIVRVVTFAALGFLLLANLSAFTIFVIALVHDKGTETATQLFSQVQQADIGAAMIAFGFWLGSSWGSRQKDDQRSAQA